MRDFRTYWHTFGSGGGSALMAFGCFFTLGLYKKQTEWGLSVGYDTNDMFLVDDLDAIIYETLRDDRRLEKYEPGWLASTLTLWKSQKTNALLPFF